MTRTVNFAKKLTSENANLSEINERMTHLKEVYIKFKEMQDIIELTCGNDDELQIQFTIREQVENYYFSAFSNFKYQIDNLSGPGVESQANTSQNSNNVKDIQLPEISLIKFGGEYVEWPSFESSFIELIQHIYHIERNYNI